MKQSTSFAQVATNLLNVLQGYSKTIRLLLVMFLALTVSANAWADFTPGTGYTLVTDISSLSTNDKVILFCNQNGEGVSGYNGNKDANVSTTAANWIEYLVTKSANSFTLKDGDKYIANPGSNEFKYGDSGGACTLGSDGLLICNSRNLMKNGSNYRFYATTQSYTSRFYVYKVAASYTITEKSNNNTYGTVSLSGTTITATPKTGYRVSTTNPYTISPSNSAKVTQNGNTFTVTPSANTTITINFEAIPKYTVTLDAGSGTCAASVTEASAGAGVTLPTPTLDGCDEWSFAGWKTTSAVTTETTTEPTLIPAGAYSPTSDITLYAVYKRTETTEGTPTTTNKEYTHTITAKTWSANGAQTLNSISWTLDNNGSYYGYDGTKGQQVGSGSFPAKSMTLTTSGFASATKITAVRISTSGASSINGTVSVKVGSTAYTSGGNTTKSLTTTNTEYEFTGSSTGNVTITWTQTSSKAIYFKTIEVDYQTTGGGSSTTIYYHSTPDCSAGDPCDALQAPNVTATATANSITLSWEAVDGATSYNVYNYTTEDLDETTNLTYTFNGLDPETEYEWEVEAVSATCNGKGTKGTTTTSATPCEQLGAATGLTVVTDFVQDGQTYVKFSWTPAAPSKEGTTQELCYGLVGQEKTCTVSAKHLGEAKGVASNLPAGEYEWSIQALGDGNNYCDGDVIKGTNFYIYSITYNTNGGNTIAATSGTTLPDPLPTPTREHYNFEGWYTDEGCTQAATAGAAITQNTTLYAKWTAKTYIITLDANGGTFVDKRDSQTKGSATFDYIYGTYATYNDAPNLTDYYTDLKRDGYQFDGWVSAGSPWNKLFTSTGDRTIQAQWSKLHTVTFNTGTNNPIVDAMEGTSETGIILPAGPTPTCTDWTFAGWWTEAVTETTTSPGELLAAGSNYKPASDCNLYAVYSHTEAGGGGSGFYLSVTKEATTYYIGEKGSGSFLSAVTDVNSAATFNIENNQYLYYGNKTYVSSTSDNTSLTIATTTPSATWAITDEGETITFKSNGTGGRYLAFNYNNGSPRFSSYNSTYTYELTKHTTSTTTYNSNPSCEVCENILSINKGAETNGTFILSQSGDIETCDGDLVVTVSEISPAEHHSVASVTATTPTTGDAPTVINKGDGTWTVTYTQNSTGESTINVTFVQDAKASITLSELGVPTTDNTTYYVGETYTLPSTSSQSCDGKQLVGWSTVEVAETDTKPTENYYELDAEVTLVAEQTFYAVFATEGEGGGGEYTLVTSANDFTDGVYVIAALDNSTYYFIDGQYTGDGIGVESTGLPVSKMSNNSFTELPSSAVEIEIEDDEDPDGENHYYFISYYDETISNWKFLDDNGTNKTLEWVEWFDGLTVYTYHPVFDSKTYLLSGSGAAISQNGTTKASFIRNYENGTIYKSLYFFKKTGSSTSYSAYTTSCVPTYSITYDFAGGTGSHCSDTSVPQGAPYTICDEEPTKEGYTFQGWSDGTSTYDGGATFTPTGDVTLTAVWKANTYTVTWNNNGDTDEVTYNHGEALVVPTAPASCDGVKEFVGWTIHSGYYHATTAPDDIFTTKTTPVTATATYYAVFATPPTTGGGSSIETTDDVLTCETTGVTEGSTNYASWSGKTATSSAVYAGNSAGGNNAIQLRSNNSNSGIVTTTSGGKVTHVEVDWESHTASDRTLDIYGRNVAYSDATDLYSTSTQGTKLGSIVYGTSTELEITGDYEYIGLRSNSGAMYLTSVTITWSSAGGSSSHTDYTTICQEVTGIAISGSYPTTFVQYDSFSFAGGIVTATFENGSTQDVTSLATFSGYNMDEVGVQTVTVTYMGQTAKYEITITESDRWRLTWNVSGKTNTGASPIYVQKGSAIGTLPVPEVPAACAGKTFMGWTESNIVPSDGKGIVYITEATVPSKNTTYYAVFATINNFSTQAAIEDIKSGSKVVIVAVASMDASGGAGQAISSRTISITTQGVIGLSGDEVSIFDETINTPHSTCIWTLTKEGGGIVFEQGGKYIRAVDGGYRRLLLETTKDYWTLSPVTGKDKTYHMQSGNTSHYVEWFDHTDSKYAEGERYIGFVPYLEANDNGDFDMQFYVTANDDGEADITDYTTGCAEYTITYYGFRGGYSTSTSSDGIIVLPVNSLHTVPDCGDVVTDHTNLGREFLDVWMTQPHGGHTFKPGDTFILTQDTTLYAQWKLETTSDVTTLPTDIEDMAGTDIYVYGGKTLNIQPGTTTINSLTLKGGLQADGSYKMPTVWVPEGATLVRNSNKINLDLIVNAKTYYPFAVPFAAKNNENVEYLDPVLAAASTYGTHFAIKTYDGARRADVGEDKANNWVRVLRGETLQPGVGYIITALTYPTEDTATIRIPMTVPNTWFQNGEQAVVGTTVRNTIAVTAHTGAAATEHKRHAGWNFVANPYLTNFAGINVENNGGLEYINGELTVNGGWQYGGEEVPYVTIPAYDFAYYSQHKLSDVKLSPEWSFFVQIGTSGTMDFSTAGRQEIPASIAARHDAAQSIRMDVDIVLSDKHHSDQMGLIICDRYTDAYEIGRDLEKLFGSAYNLSVYTLMEDNTPLAFQALAIRSSMQVIPVGYRAPEQGEYTFRLNEATSSIDLLNEQYEQLVLVDYQTGELTNLLYTDYTFYSERTQSNSRFAIYAVPRQNAPTDLPNIDDGDNSTRKILHNGHLYILRDGKVYNGHGQIVK